MRPAHRALGVDRQAGLLLPCNVIVRTEDDRALAPVAGKAARLLRVALDTLTRAGRQVPAR